ncbi:MAG: sulfatase-like hydrolase/transferase [Lachnospiraceae bacterium]|nr:sulfatase-like hydrolase/transferase [Lachnospiraceae bacterium]
MNALFMVIIEPIILLMETIFTIICRIASLETTVLCIGIFTSVVFLPLFLTTYRIQKKEYLLQLEQKDAHPFQNRILLYLPFLFQTILFIASFNFFSQLDIVKGESLWMIPDIMSPDGLLFHKGFLCNIFPLLFLLVYIITSVVKYKYSIKLLIISLGFGVEQFILLNFAPSGFACFEIISIFVFSLAELLFVIIVSHFNYLQKKPQVEGDRTIKEKTNTNEETEQKKYQYFFIVAGVIYMILLTGCYIPSNIIKESPAEFIDVLNIKNPLHFLVYSSLLAVGTFAMWLLPFYFLVEKKVKMVLDSMIWILCSFAFSNYIVSGNYWGEVLPNLMYYDAKEYEFGRVIVSVLVGMVLGIVFYVLISKKPDFARILVLAEVAVLLFGIVTNIIKIESKYYEMDYLHAENDNRDVIHLSKNGKNVIVLIMDMALGSCEPYIFNEKPELKEQFDGFTYYPNTISFAAFTNMGIPAVYGGYEYAPEEMNARNEESLEDKHNEALKVMPVIFSQNGYNVTVCDPVYAGYQWIPDLSVYSEYPDIKTYNTEGRFGSSAPEDAVIMENLLKRNLFYHSMVKIMPLLWQMVFFNNGNYCDAQINNLQTTDSLYVSDGYLNDFLDSYLVLENLSDITTIEDESGDNFLLFYNATPHMPCLLQEPNYTPAKHVDNRIYHLNDDERFSIGEDHIRMEEEKQLTYYDVNMAMFLQLGKWLDYLKENDCYDNTRIVIVADHGRNTNYYDLINEKGLDTEYFWPLLMVKEFDSKGLEVDRSIMTNADTPFLATHGIIDSPINPFSGKEIKSSSTMEKNFTVFFSEICQLEDNNGNRFKPGDWYLVQENPRSLDNWKYLGSY